MDSISKFLQIAAGIILALLLISFVFMAFTSQQDTANQALTKTNEMNNTLMESEYTQYDAATVAGSEVINIIKKFQNDDIYIGVCVTATNGVGSSFDYYNRDSSLGTSGIKEVASAKVKTNPNYIAPSATFLGQVVRDDNTDAIIGITFTRQQ